MRINSQLLRNLFQVLPVTFDQLHNMTTHRLLQSSGPRLPDTVTSGCTYRCRGYNSNTAGRFLTYQALGKENHSWSSEYCTMSECF